MNLKYYIKVRLLFLMLFPLCVYSSEDEIYRSAELEQLPVIGSVNFRHINQDIEAIDIADVNNDGQDEMIFYHNSNKYGTIRVYAQSQDYIDILSFSYKLIALKIFKRNSKTYLITAGKPEPFTINLYLYVFEQNEFIPVQQQTMVQGTDRNKDKFWDVELLQFFPFPEPDNRIAIMINTGYDHFPRGLYVFQIDPLEKKWEYQIGGSPAQLEFVGTGEDLTLLVSTVAPNNGYTVNNISDTASYLIRLSEHGQFLDALQRGGKFSYTLLQKIWRENGKYDFLYRNSSGHHDENKQNYIDLIDPYKLETKSRIISPDISEGISPAVFLNNIQFDFFKIPVLSTNRNIYFYDKNNRITRRLNFDNFIYHILAADLNRDQKPEFLLLAKTEPKLIITDHNFNLIGKINGIDFYNNCFIRTETEQRQSKVYFVYKNMITEWSVPFNEIKTESSLSAFWRLYGKYVINFLVVFASILMIILMILEIIKRSRELKVSKYLFNYLMRNTSRGILIVNNQNVIEHANSYLNELFGLSEPLLPGKQFSEIDKFIDTADFYKTLSDLSQTNSHSNFKSEIIVQTTDGPKKLLCSVQNVKPVKSKNYTVYELIDLTRIARENQLAAWGSLTQRMAHEIKNPLTTLLLTLQQLQRKILQKYPDESELTSKYVDSAAEEIERLRQSTNALMKFTSAAEEQISEFDINQIIRDSVATFDLNENIDIQYQLDRELPFIKADEQKIRQVIYNLLENSIDAIKEEGSITLSTQKIEKIDSDSGFIQPFIRVEITDNGSGIDPAIINKIFEPNFTTKSAGTGFGLAISKFIIEQISGKISVSSKPGSGTIFTIQIPLKIRTIH